MIVYVPTETILLSGFAIWIKLFMDKIWVILDQSIHILLLKLEQPLTSMTQKFLAMLYLMNNLANEAMDISSTAIIVHH